MRRRPLAALALLGSLALGGSPVSAQTSASKDSADRAYKEGLQRAELSPRAEEWVNMAMSGFVAIRLRAGFARRADLDEAAIVDTFEEEVMPRLALEGIDGQTRAYMLSTIIDRLALAKERLATLDEAQARFKTAVVGAVSDPTAQGRLIYDAIDRLQGRSQDLWQQAAAEPGAAKGAADLTDEDEPWMPPALPRLVRAELADLYEAADASDDTARQGRLDESAARLAQATSEWLELALQNR